MKPRFLTILLVALVGLVGLLCAKVWVPWLDVVRVAGAAHWSTVTTVITVLLLASIAVASVATTWHIRHRERLGTLPAFRQVLQFMGCVFLVVLLTGGSFVAPLTGSFSKSVYVSEGGNLNAAVKGAAAGWTVMVGPGTYFNCTNIGKNLVNLQGFGHPTLTSTNRTNDGGFGIIDDRFSGAITSRVDGFNFVWSAGIPGTNADGTACCMPTNLVGGITLTNPASDVRVTFGDFKYQILSPLNQGIAAISVWNCRYSSFVGDRLMDFNFQTNYFVGLDDIGGDIYAQSQATGLYWQQGEEHFDIDYINGNLYAIWPDCPASALNNTNDLYGRSDFVASEVYISTTATNPPRWRTWLTLVEIASPTEAYSIIGGGKHYLLGNSKMSTTGSGEYTVDIRPTGAGSVSDVWITTQKITAKTGFLLLAGGTVDLTCQDYEDDNATPIGFMLTGGLLNAHGGNMTVSNGVGISYTIGARARIKNMVIDTSSTATIANYPVSVATNGLILENVTVIAPNNSWAIRSASTNNVVSKSVWMNKGSSNILMTVGPTTIDSNVR